LQWLGWTLVLPSVVFLLGYCYKAIRRNTGCIMACSTQPANSFRLARRANNSGSAQRQRLAARFSFILMVAASAAGSLPVPVGFVTPENAINN
jgi:hypothetical protein